MNIFSDIAEKLLGSKDKTPGSPLAEIKDINEQTPEETKLANFVRTKVDESRQSNSRTNLESTFLTNIAYLMGYSGVSYDTTYRQFKNSENVRRGSSKFKVNKILPTIQNRLARLTQAPPRYDVRPNSNSTKDKDKSRFSLQVLNDIFQKERFNEKRQDLLMSGMQGGHAYVQVQWDPTKGKPVVDPEIGEFNGEYEGDVRLEILSCLEVFPDPLAKNTDEMGHWTKAKVRKLEYFRQRYPGRGNAIKEEDAWLMSSIYDLKANALTNSGVSGASTQEQMKNSAIELVYYEKRSKEHPKGRMVVTANGILLEDKQLPLGEFDLVKFDDIMIGGRYNAEAVITHLRPIQDQYNIARGKMADWVRKLLAGKYIAAKGHGLGQESLTTESGEVLEYDPVVGETPPQAMNIPSIPSYAYKELETLEQEFNQISGLNEVSQGIMPSASIPAAGMALLQEQDQTRIGVQISRNETGYAKVGALVLKYVSKYYKLPRLLKDAGDGLEYTIKEFVGSDIDEDPDVIVIEGSTIPTSQVLRRQDIGNALGMGILGNPQDPKVQSKVLKMMEFGDANEMWKDQALDDAQVKKIISAIEEEKYEDLKGQLSEFDNQSWHLQEMNQYRKTDKFTAFNPKQKETFLGIMEWRLQSLNNTLNPQVSQQQNMAQQLVDNFHAQETQGGSPGPLDQAGGQQAPQPQQEPPMPQQGA